MKKGDDAELRKEIADFGDKLIKMERELEDQKAEGVKREYLIAQMALRLEHKDRQVRRLRDFLAATNSMIAAFESV